MKLHRLILFASWLFVVSTGQAQTYIGDEREIQQILSEIRLFSEAVMASDYDNIANAYTTDGKIFPNNREIISGRDSIRAYWVLPEGVRTSYHHITPLEIKITGDEAYDYGYYEGTTLRADGTESHWRGKYVIIWRKVDEEWKIYLDIWNRISD